MPNTHCQQRTLLVNERSSEKNKKNHIKIKIKIKGRCRGKNFVVGYYEENDKFHFTRCQQGCTNINRRKKGSL